MNPLRKYNEMRKAAARRDQQYELGYRHWKEINDDPGLAAMSGFLLYGWGKFDGIGLAEDCSGSLTDPDDVRAVLAANGIEADAELTEGLHWC